MRTADPGSSDSRRAPRRRPSWPVLTTAPAVNPVLDLLKQGESQINGGNLQAALNTLGGFPALWQKASPVIQPLAGDKWPAIDNAAQRLIKMVDGSDPTKAEASSAVSGLMGPLSALVGQ
ncbi:hypothetical protein CPCC7001_1852 [Cyanobium sp. PCC 7001]|uniref:hypothetical protein n=1 Tax=Cyanobium sp. PCC 7001 TaxID=180281 RepID=UPI0001805D54|nr:hypothetical protein [Cyanobium sp. PCC 7001]EDY38973.1 hypothetical protein CPCC7001_1852 [Cyanobium sp. PCC 7001]